MGAVSKVVLVPRNGYINRLQAWASASITARTWACPLQVYWEEEGVSPARATDLLDLCPQDSYLIQQEDLFTILGQRHDDLPRYLNWIPNRRVLVLAGHDLGEQVFMSELHQLVENESDPLTVVFISGGKFHLPDEASFDQKRRNFYQSLTWTPPIREAIKAFDLRGQSYLGVHIRTTDKSLTMPTQRDIKSRLLELSTETGIDSIFIAADTHVARQNWTNKITKWRKIPYTARITSGDRKNPTAGIGAMVDWNLLAGAKAIVFSRDSSFGSEAALGNDDSSLSVGVSPGALTSTIRKTHQVVRNVATYPVRHGPRMNHGQ